MRVTAIIGHASEYPEPISFSPGDQLTVGRKESEYPGWLWVGIASGKEGWAPESYMRRLSASEAVASREYTARELDTEAGERLVVHAELNEWLWVENESGRCGWVPKKTVRAA